jgi:CiaD-like protein
MKEDRVAKEENSSSVDGEILFLNSLKERLLVLFEGFQAPNNTNIEAKVDMTLNFLEYALATIDLRAEELEKGKVK